MNNDLIKEVKKLLATKKKIAIVCHRNPDGDAYGSSLALYHFLKNDHEVTVVSPNDCPSFLKWLPGQRDIVLYENNEPEAQQILHNADVVFTLDFNAFHRTGDLMGKYLETIQPLYIMIDHHQQPDDYAAYTFSDVAKSSTCEMVYDFIESLGALDKIDNTIATCIYTGIMTDTGSFRFDSTKSSTHNIAANLLHLGVDNSLIYNRINDISTNRMKLLGKALNNMVVLEDLKTAYISLSQRELSQCDYQKGDTEGFVNYALSLKGIVLAVIFIEDKMQGIIKMSFRSKGSFSVNEFARAYFNGGGHTNAAGGKSQQSLKRTIGAFLKIIPKYKTDLQNSYEI